MSNDKEKWFESLKGQDVTAKNKNKSVSRMRLMRLKCLDCCCDSAYEVSLCNMKQCSIWGYRFGCGPTAKRFTKQHGNGWIYEIKKTEGTAYQGYWIQEVQSEENDS